MSEDSCPFCAVDEENVFYRGENVIGLWDAMPVSPGHALLITHRHVPAWFDARPDEQAELMRAVAVARAAIETEYQPNGYNIGVNVGRAAGQTLFHLHVHVIPRYEGDVANPRGGVRHVIPGKGDYLASEDRSTEQRRSGMVHAPGLVRGGQIDPLLPQLLEYIDRADCVDIAAAFILQSGVRLIEEHLRDVLNRGGRVRILTGDYLGVTEPNALMRLLDLQEETSLDMGAESAGEMLLRIFESNGTSFHPKAYIVTPGAGKGIAFVGSSNLTETALRKGIEWNYRVVDSRDNDGLTNIHEAFERLWDHRQNQTLDVRWVRNYEKRRSAPAPRLTGVPPEPAGEPPNPHPVQAEALAALEETRKAGNTAGLVVLATGLGKTWLSAFDSIHEAFPRVLFIAHREEILSQAMRTFRTIRPDASLGYYTGAEKTPEADVLFASIQTLSRREHLHKFQPDHFEYVVMDEFHHAAARTYRRVLGYLEPQFLLGLTATPERTDGSDLLSLCGDNLVYRCDLVEGIRRGLLSPFDYFGVPDVVDYETIPWRSTRFDEEKLTDAVATRARAQNALDQYNRLSGTRTLGFCVSQRHADFMADFFRDAGLEAVAVHSGERSAPRARSLEQLQEGSIDVLFAVDMFNEGVDLPNVDTVMMLRPTESRILWLQQFGRGLRYQSDKTLQVIDYIGNHRVFLNKTRALFNLGTGDREVAYILDRLDRGDVELPPGCSVQYELEAKEILRGLIRTTGSGDQLRRFYEEFRELHGVRPLALEAFEQGYDPKTARRDGYSSWFGFVRMMGDLSEQQEQVLERFSELVSHLEVTPMTRSYKMLVLLAMLDEDAFPGTMTIDRLTERFAGLARRFAPLRTELGEKLRDSAELRRLIENNPIKAWVGGKGTGGHKYFRYNAGSFETTFSLPEEQRECLQDLIREIAEWRLHLYIHRTHSNRARDRVVCRVSHANGRPILFLPDRDTHPGIPEGWQPITADGSEYQANFVKIAVNVITTPGETTNVLPDVLRRWFGPRAGQPGRTDEVAFERAAVGYTMLPASELTLTEGPILWEKYSREEALNGLGIKPTGWERQSGIVSRDGMYAFFVTLDKDELADAYQYSDQFESPTEFKWQSQNRNTQAGKVGQDLRQHRERGTRIHLFVRKQKSRGDMTEAFVYCGELSFVRWEGEKPITVWWELAEPVPEKLRRELSVPTE